MFRLVVFCQIVLVGIAYRTHGTHATITPSLRRMYVFAPGAFPRCMVFLIVFL